MKRTKDRLNSSNKGRFNSQGMKCKTARSSWKETNNSKRMCSSRSSTNKRRERGLLTKNSPS